MKTIYGTGYIPSLSDARDFPLQAIISKLDILPEQYSLEPYVLRVDDQVSKPWCVTFAICNAIEFAMRSRGVKVPEGGFSKAWLYTRCKEIDGVPGQDGTYIRVALSIALKEGLCPDYLCPTGKYLQEDKLPVLTNEMAKEAAKYKIKSYARLQDAKGNADNEQVKQALASKQFVVIGSLVEQDNWMDGDDLITEPKGYVLGAHCTYLYEYNDNRVRAGYTGFDGGVNSWGLEWGDHGKYDMAYNYINWRDLDTGMPAFLEAWTFVVDGEVSDFSCKSGTIWIDRKVALLDGKEVLLDQAPTIDKSSDRTLVPMRFMAEHMGYQVDWDGGKRQIHFYRR